jgi:RNA polymerase sigma factor (sigma-70 family)
MVLAICRQILRHHHDADDAFQATFLVLVRKADSIETEESLAPWLSSVAFRTAQRARSVVARLQTIDAEQLDRRASDTRPQDDFQIDVRPLLFEELDRLPVKFRDAIVLCHLEGKSHEEAARLLSWPVGTVSSRLSRGRQLLRSRLARRGVAVSAAALSVSWLSGASMTLAPSLVEPAVAAAMASSGVLGLPVSVLSLTRGVLRIMWFRKLSKISLLTLAIGSAGGFAVWAHWPSAAARADVPNRQAAPAPAATDESIPQRRGEMAQPPRQSQASGGADVLADRATETDDCFPDYCPLSLAANAVSRLFDTLHGAP